MNRIELFNTKEVAEIIGVSIQTIGSRCRLMKITPYKSNGTKSNFYDRTQISQIANIDFKSPESNKPIVHTVHLHTVFHIYESKLNTLQL